MMIWQQTRIFIKSLWLIYLAGFLTLTPVMIIVLNDAPKQMWPLSIGLFALFGLFFGGSILLLNFNPKYAHLYFSVQTIILLWLVNLHPTQIHTVGVLFLPIASQAPLFLPLLSGFLWVFAYIAMVVVVIIGAGGSTYEILSQSMLAATGYIGFGAFGASLRESENRRQQGERLLIELQEAHEQLKKYTEQAEQLAVAEERNRLAREMHDALGHRLTVAVVQLEGAKRLIPTAPERAASIVDNMRTQLKEALAELRLAVSSLRMENDRHEEEVDLKTAVSTLVNTFQSATGLTVHLHIPPNFPSLPSQHHRALYRAVQESLTNVQRHAQAATAWVDVSTHNEYIQLTIRDDGKGFSGKIEDGRFGLRGLQERATKLGGQMSFHTIQPTGAQLQFTLPLPEANHG